ncbi:hypothetical protein LXL04_033613 [Taraxacum kok-saghyz]
MSAAGLKENPASFLLRPTLNTPNPRGRDCHCCGSMVCPSEVESESRRERYSEIGSTSPIVEERRGEGATVMDGRRCPPTPTAHIHNARLPLTTLLTFCLTSNTTSSSPASHLFTTVKTSISSSLVAVDQNQERHTTCEEDRKP